MTTEKNSEDLSNVIPLKDGVRPGSSKWLQNYDTAFLSDRGKPTKMGRTCSTMHDILSSIWKYPLRRVGNDLFVIQDGKARYIYKVSQLFAWFADQGISVDWIKSGTAVVAKDEFLDYLACHVESYEAISARPHWPPLQGVYYLPMASYPSVRTGVLDELVSMWTPASEVDRQLMICALISPFWGGRPGSRPCFVLDSEDGDALGGRGVGKSKFTEVLSRIAGGYIDLDLSVTGEEMKRRILKADGQGIVRFDNVKTNRASSAAVESLITCPVVSGHGFGTGLKSMANHFTYVFTFNGVSMSKDLAQRSVHIRLRRGAWKATWEDEVDEFVTARHGDILSDIRAILEAPAGIWPVHMRFSSWERGVAQRVFGRELNQPGDIADRQVAIDDDQNISDQIAECFETNISRYYRCGFGGRVCLDASSEEYGVLVERHVAVGWLKSDLGLDRGMTMNAVLKLIRRANVSQILSTDVKYGSHRYLRWQKCGKVVGAWKINSAVEKIIRDEDFHRFYGQNTVI